MFVIKIAVVDNILALRTDLNEVLEKCPEDLDRAVRVSLLNHQQLKLSDSSRAINVSSLSGPSLVPLRILN